MKIQHFIALGVLSLATVAGARAAVLAGPITNAANGHLYYLLSANTWTASEAEAIGLGGHLVTINDAAENQWVVNAFFPLTGGPNDWLWIGLNDAVNEGQFFWAGEEGAIAIWASGEPFTTDVEDYAAIERLSGRWRDLSDTYGLENPTAPTFGVVEVAVAVTQPANQFMPGGARLNGRVSPIGSPTLAWFEWGTSLAYGNATPFQSVGSGGHAVGFSNVVAGLVSGTNYHFRARASNGFGSFAGLNQTFNLGSQRPGVTSLAADQLSYTSARLKGQVNPRGWPTAAWFEWGTTANYGNVIGMQDIGQGSSASNLNVVLNGLTTGTNYHYRLVATNAFGAVYGANQTINLGVVPTKITWTGADPSGYWSAPANWFPNGVPTNGADLVFLGSLPPEDMVSTNDLTDSIFRSITFNQDSRHTFRGNPITLTNRTDAILHSGTNVIACDLIFSGTPSTPTFTTIRSSDFRSGELTVIGNVGGGSLHIGGGFWRMVIMGQFTGGSLFVDWYATLALYGDNSYAVSADVSGSTLLVQGSQPNLNIKMWYNQEDGTPASLSGNGQFGDVTRASGGTRITPDSTLSVKNISAGPLLTRLNGTNVGECGKLVASGEVNLSGGSLVPSAGFNPQPGQVFTIVEKTAPGPIRNAFLGPEGKITTLNGMPFRISYVGGDGNDVTLTTLGFVPIPIPGLPEVFDGSVAWGDYDNDGRLDFLLTGRTGGSPVSQVWRNTGSGFSNVTSSVASGLPGVENGSVAWGDYDNDGRLDFLLTGSFHSQLWRNTGSAFSNVTASVAPGLPGVNAGSVAWGDYDNDGRLDFLLTGYSTSLISQVWRNTGSGFSNVTASVAPVLPGVNASYVAWGDYDNDGRLDFLLTGFANVIGNTFVSQVWRNTGSSFSNVTASVATGLPRVADGSVAWGDYDNDGQLDFLLTGLGRSQVWRNTGSGFSNVTASVAPVLPGVNASYVAWGDYDNDGRLDFLLTGATNSVPPQLWRNTGGGFSNVTARVAPGLPGLYSSSGTWGDFDNDGRLDFLFTGSGISQLWRNNMPVAANAPPAAPTGLSATLSGATVSLSWNPPADDQTPFTGLNYNLRIGTTPGASDVLAPMALTDGLRLLPALGNAQAGTDAVMNLPFGQYYWSVQAVDTSFAGSPFAVEQQFIIAPHIFEPLLLSNGHFQFSFTNRSSAVYEVLGTTNASLPLAQWTVQGPPVSLGGGLYRFTDTGAMGQAQRFYILRAQ